MSFVSDIASPQLYERESRSLPFPPFSGKRQSRKVRVVAAPSRSDLTAKKRAQSLHQILTEPQGCVVRYPREERVIRVHDSDGKAFNVLLLSDQRIVWPAEWESPGLPYFPHPTDAAIDTPPDLIEPQLPTTSPAGTRRAEDLVRPELQTIFRSFVFAALVMIVSSILMVGGLIAWGAGMVGLLAGSVLLVSNVLFFRDLSLNYIANHNAEGVLDTAAATIRTMTD